MLPIPSTIPSCRYSEDAKATRVNQPAQYCNEPLTYFLCCAVLCCAVLCCMLCLPVCVAAAVLSKAQVLHYEESWLSVQLGVQLSVQLSVQELHRYQGRD